MSWKTILFTIITVLLVVFTMQNHILISLKFINWEMNDVPLIFVLLGALVSGFLLAQIMQMPKIYRLRRDLKKALRDLEKAEKTAVKPEEKSASEDMSMGKDYKGGFFDDKE